jgi:hypothetical protein
VVIVNEFDNAVTIEDWYTDSPVPDDSKELKCGHDADCLKGLSPVGTVIPGHNAKKLTLWFGFVGGNHCRVSLKMRHKDFVFAP